MERCTMTTTSSSRPKVINPWNNKKLDPISDKHYALYLSILEVLDKYPHVIFDLLHISLGLVDKVYFTFLSRIHKEKEDVIILTLTYYEPDEVKPRYIDLVKKNFEKKNLSRDYYRWDYTKTCYMYPDDAENTRIRAEDGKIYNACHFSTLEEALNSLNKE